MFKLTVETRASMFQGDLVEIKTYFSNGTKEWMMSEIIPSQELKENLGLFDRMIDKCFYEMKRQVKKYHGILEGK